MIRRFASFLFLFLLVISCKRDNYTVKGVCEGMPDGTMLYMSPYRVSALEELLVPVDSATVRNGRFEFNGKADGSALYFISSSRVIDGGFIVVEPGKISFDMAEKTRRGGTEKNEQLDRFLNEKERLIAIRGMCEPRILDVIAHTEEVRDSVKKMASLANLVFDMYVSKIIDENIDNCLGHFFFTQSVGVASPGSLIRFIGEMPEEMRDIMFESKKLQLNSLLDEKSVMNSYIAHANRTVRETSVGRKYINFELDNIDGGKILFSDIVGASEYTLLCFWGSWNRKSLSLLEELAKLSPAYKGQSLGLVTVSLDADTDDCRNIISAADIKGIHLCNPGGGSAEVASAYGVYDLPCALLVNSFGTIILRTGSVDDISSKLEEIF